MLSIATFAPATHLGASSWLSGLNLGFLLPLCLGLGNGGNGHVMLVPLLGLNCDKQEQHLYVRHIHP
jgi:hypothetical protein